MLKRISAFDDLDSTEVQDLTYLDWKLASRSNNGSTGGSYLKAYDVEDGRNVYYKLSAFSKEDGSYGHESINEVIVCRLCDILGFEHLHYELVHARIRVSGNEYVAWLVKSYDFRRVYERKLTFESYCTLQGYKGKDRTEVWRVVDNCTFRDSIYQMVLLDYLIYNRDRHGANIEVLYNTKEDSYRLAPIFDNGLSLLAPLQNDLEQVMCYNELNDSPVNNFIGSMFLSECLERLKGKVTLLSLDLECLYLDDLNKCFSTAGNVYTEKIKKMIKMRYDYAASVLNS